MCDDEVEQLLKQIIERVFEIRIYQIIGPKSDASRLGAHLMRAVLARI